MPGDKSEELHEALQGPRRLQCVQKKMAAGAPASIKQGGEQLLGDMFCKTDMNALVPEL